MLTSYVYDNIAGVFREWRGKNRALPYAVHAELFPGELLGRSSLSQTLWTDRRLIEAYDALCLKYGARLPVRGGFHRAREGRKLNCSGRVAGLVLDMGYDMPDEKREELRKLCVRSRLFEYVCPSHITPTWVSVEKVIAPPCSPSRRYPRLESGDIGVHVFALQDTLAAYGFEPDALNGEFDRSTEYALKHFCKANGVEYPGAADGNIWRLL